MTTSEEPTRPSVPSEPTTTPIWALPSAGNARPTLPGGGNPMPDPPPHDQPTPVHGPVHGPAQGGETAARSAAGWWTRGRTAAVGAVAAAVIATAGITAAALTPGNAAAGVSPGDGSTGTAPGDGSTGTAPGDGSTGTAPGTAPGDGSAAQPGTGGTAQGDVGGPGAQDGRRGAFPGGLRGGGLAGSLHATYVVPDADGGYVTRESQNGTVSAVDASTISVTSADGYKRSYTVNADTSVNNGGATIGDVAAGHTVLIVATVSGSTATAIQVVDTSLTGAAEQGSRTAPGAGLPEGDLPEAGVPGAGAPPASVPPAGASNESTAAARTA